jgi:hypothetical protein
MVVVASAMAVSAAAVVVATPAVLAIVAAAMPVVEAIVAAAIPAVTVTPTVEAIPAAVANEVEGSPPLLNYGCPPSFFSSYSPIVYLWKKTKNELLAIYSHSTLCLDWYDFCLTKKQFKFKFEKILGFCYL